MQHLDFDFALRFLPPCPSCNKSCNRAFTLEK